MIDTCLEKSRDRLLVWIRLNFYVFFVGLVLRKRMVDLVLEERNIDFIILRLWVGLGVFLGFF